MPHFVVDAGGFSQQSFRAGGFERRAKAQVRVVEHFDDVTDSSNAVLAEQNLVSGPKLVDKGGTEAEDEERVVGREREGAGAASGDVLGAHDRDWRA